MFEAAIFIGIYSYIIFSLGVLNLLRSGNILIVSILFFVFVFVYLLKNAKIKLSKKINFFKYKLLIATFFLIITQIIVNLIGALGLELGFDALWYHLTIPKLFILGNSIFHIPGGLLYYSNMPKLTEMLYIPGLLLGGELIPKLIHFSFGTLSCIAVYKILRKFVNPFYSSLGIIVFYANLVVGWQSITAYIDLARTFFEVMALWGFLNFLEKKEKTWLVESGVMVGLAISSKLLALGSIGIFIILLILIQSKKNYKKLAQNIIIFITPALLVPLPWFVFSWLNTGSPFYPFFTSIYPVGFSFSLFNPINLFMDTLTLFMKSADPISPVYLIFSPLVIYFFINLSSKERIILIYSLLAIIVWYIAPRTGGGRFIMPYLPALSILVVIVLSKIKNELFLKYLIVLIFIVSLMSIVYRGLANTKYIPYILGLESKDEFLSEHLNFSFGDFYDTGGYFEKTIKSDDKVLLYGFHNLYHVDFPFIDSSWVKKGDGFTHIAVQNSHLPKRFSDWNLIYHNPITRVQLFKKGDSQWFY